MALRVFWNESGMDGGYVQAPKSRDLPVLPKDHSTAKKRRSKLSWHEWRGALEKRKGGVSRT